jgi:hypothetical protein
LIALLILLLILLPLYLWPLRGAMTGPRGAAALSGSPRDPRNASEVARIPGDVWDALLGPTAEPAPPKAPRNLTMIAQLEEVAGVEAIGLMSGVRPPMMASLLDDPSHALESNASGDGSPSSPVQFLTGPFSGEQGTGNGSDGFGSNGYPGLSNLGPWGGGGSGGRGGAAPLLTSSDPTWNPSDPGSPAPTPEPATILLVGSNLTLLGAMAWRRRRRREETDLNG